MRATNIPPRHVFHTKVGQDERIRNTRLGDTKLRRSKSSDERTRTVQENENLERRIKARAYQIWMEEGQPEGKDREHWIRAKAEVLAREPLLMEEDMNRNQTDKEARRVVEGGEADRKGQREQGDSRTAGQGVARDQRGQDQPADKRRAQKSQTEGPAAYAPHQEDEGERVLPDRKPTKKKAGEF